MRCPRSGAPAWTRARTGSYLELRSSSGHMTAMWWIVSCGARSNEYGCSNVGGVLCPKMYLR